MNFQLTFFNVLLVLMYAIPGYILIKTKVCKKENISLLATILLYVNGPALMIDAFQQVDFSWSLVGEMALFGVITLILQILLVLIIYLIFKRKYKASAIIRISSVSSVCGNVGFFGLPILQAVLKDFPQAAIYSTMFILSMNILMFTLGSYCITNNKRFLSIKSAIFNPAVIAILIAFPLFLFNFKIPVPFANGVSLLGKMTTPLCMIILGMRLASVSLKKMFTNYRVYLVCLMKLIVFPLAAYAAVYFLPVDEYFKITILVLSATPCASVILSVAEMLGEEQEFSANVVLISTLLTLITIPLILLII